MAAIVEVAKLGIDAATNLAERGGENSEALGRYLTSFGICTNGVSSAFEEHPAFAVTGALAGGVIGF
jgi:hypothetical protein